MKLSEKAIKKVEEANKCLPKYCMVQGIPGPTGPQGITGPIGPTGPQGEIGPSSTSIFSGMYSTIGYPIRISSIDSEYGIIFNMQSLTRGDFGFEPGSINLASNEIIPGQLIIQTPGIYEVYFGLSNLTTTVPGDFEFQITRNDGNINRGVARITMAPNTQYSISRLVITQLNVGDVIGLEVKTFVTSNGLLSLSGNHVEMLVIKISDS